MENKKITLLKYALLAFFVWFAIMGRWIYRSFGPITYDQLIFHLNIPFVFEGLEPTFYIKFLKHCILPFIAFMLLYYLLRKYFFLKDAKNYRYEKYFLIFLIGICIIVAHIFWRFDKLYTQSKLATTYGNFYEERYKTPIKEEIIFPQKKRNLIFIVLESMESTFAKKDSTQDKFSPFEDLIPNLRQIAENEVSFSDTNIMGGGEQSYGVTWTIAGLVGYHCAIPLRLPIDGNSFGRIGGTFLGGAVCLGDILHNAGYKQISLVPVYKNFSGLGPFFSTHQINTQDLEYYTKKQKLPRQFEGFWGIKDGILFDLAKDELMQLAQQDQPFAFYLLTVDTHAKVGYTDKERCKVIYEENNDNNKYKNAISCTDLIVGDFIKWIKQQDFYKNTTIVILGDHLSMNQDFFPKNAHRRIYNAFINPNFFHTMHDTKNRRFSHFDMLPTILDSLGVEVKSHKLGLGVDLLSQQPTLLESGNYEEAIMQKSRMYENFLYKTNNYGKPNESLSF